MCVFACEQEHLFSLVKGLKKGMIVYAYFASFQLGNNLCDYNVSYHMAAIITDNLYVK